MSGLETAIRHALERSDRTSAETRAKIYQSARNALEAGLRKQDVHDTEVIAQQRHRLEGIIHAIETQERAALKAQAASVVPPPVHPDDTIAGDDRRHAANDDAGTVMSVRREPEAQAEFSGDDSLDGLRPERFDETVPAGPAVAVPVEKLAGKPVRERRASVASPAKPRRRRGRFLSFLLVVVTLGAAFGAALWWAETSGLLKSDAERDTSVANPPATVRSEDFDGSQGLTTLGSQSGFTGDWIEVFKPTDIAQISPRSRATADPVSDEAGPRVRVTSATADADGDVLIEVPVSVLEQLSGKTSTVALTVRSGADKPTQFSVECDFASLGDCGRHRFTVNDEKVDMLFKVTFDRSLAPSAPGRILINSDVAGSGQSLNLFAIRILPGQ
ncbi:biotin transporter BioY [Pararhizobium antarcticum]|uniref:Biotin transporter BioY n=1 Tax=Pararhizobium antarcticum TaxID=1798805 RepID=A0A657LP77_9HYPH|nr:biotin transporter BioY [Pararhizobium antarcticum]OJF92690.1 biotin transporter BioY [Pararhizobium antarcticum]OJF98521.1 biotin transporter BioY [Rhizobium sp. 58]